MTKENWNPKPKDDKTWWLMSHCGPGTLNEKDLCPFCGRTYKKCAEICTKLIKENHEQICGGSGFWCPKCGLFYPQDSCGETYDSEYQTWSGKQIIVKDNKVFCHCGEYLFNKIN